MSETRRLRLILHGKAAARDEVRAAVEAVRGLGHAVSVRVTWEEGDTQRLAREALADDEAIDVLVAGGGDGTLNEVVSSVLEVAGEDRPPFAFALLPLGTANDFAHGLGLPVEDPTACLTLAATGQARPTDVGTVNGQVFVNVVSGGFGAEVTTETDPTLKRLIGGAAYLLTGLNKVGAIEAVAAHIRVDGEDGWRGRFVALAVGNGRRAGGGVPLSPDAELDDGLLDLIVVPEPERGDVGQLVQGFLETGAEALRAHLVMRRAARIEIETERPIQVNLDGEPLHAERLDIRVLPGRIRLVRPDASGRGQAPVAKDARGG
ncbi:lipid kinase YegS [Polymorphum gilvum]|uniref:DAGKc domain-containing protein n=1 Tax=Polymorphum gilvum (strain LMG 25793 / CGMCC 1.9160 / SL003B-26A1) TaxID=991905 RepID=F2IVG8_POLGS|nr:lipid kinase YegS [Polymorphum gilvum]ADZ72686.1 hypothetical protein SL003B_4269 [Polymorphum gilvum SL003B-26A1]